MPSSSAAEELGDSPKPVLGESFWTTFPKLVMRATWIIVILSILTQLFTVILESRSLVDLIGLAVMAVGLRLVGFSGFGWASGSSAQRRCLLDCWADFRLDCGQLGASWP